MWEDPEFKADGDSLFWPKEWGWSSKVDRHVYREPPGGRQWKRPSEIGARKKMKMTSEKPSLWGDKGISPAGVRQHALGNCAFLAAASAVAEVPERIERLFWNTEYNANGAFRIYLYLNSEWVGINIDDRLPLHHMTPLGTWPSLDNAWWMPLLEKAFAKAYRTYDGLLGFHSRESMKTMTGMPGYVFKFEKTPKDVVHKRLKLYTEKNYPLTSSSGGPSKYGNIKKRHGFTVLDLHKFKNGEELVKLRNPWSKTRYNGKWNKNDPNWTEEMKAEIGGLTEGNDGFFWMPFDKYYKVFGSIHVTFWEEYEGYRKVKHTFKPG